MSAIDVFQAKGLKIASANTRYDCELQVNNLLVGGVPSTPNVIRGWLRSRLDKIDGEVKDAALEQLVEQTLRERFAGEQPSVDDMITALMADESAGLSVNGFKRTASGELGYESRCLKAAVKEAVNSAYPGVDWDGKAGAKGIAPRKGLKSTLEERVIVEGTLIPLGVKASEVLPNEPEIPVPGSAWVEERVKHVLTPQGPKSALNRVEVVFQPTLNFTLVVADDFLAMEAWARVWERLEMIGIGADRGRSDGQCVLTKFDKIA